MAFAFATEPTTPQSYTEGENIDLTWTVSGASDFQDLGLINGNAETGDMTGWTAVSNISVRSTLSNPTTDTLGDIFTGGAGAACSMDQELTISAGEYVSVSVEFWHGGYFDDSDTGGLRLDFFSSGGSTTRVEEILPQYNPYSGGYDKVLNGNRYWKYRGIIDTSVPATTARLRLRPSGQRNKGTNLDFYMAGFVVTGKRSDGSSEIIYQPKKGGVNYGASTTTTDTSYTLSIPSAQKDDSGEYSLVATNNDNAITSENVLVYVGAGGVAINNVYIFRNLENGIFV